MPVIAAGLGLVAIHALLNHRPLALVRDKKTVQIKLKSVLHRGAVDFCHQATGADQRSTVKSEFSGQRGKLVRRAARMLAASAADVDAELVPQRRQPSP